MFASTGEGILGFNVFAYCNNNSVNMNDSKGRIPKELSLEFFAASAYGGGGSKLGPYIPIPTPYEEIPYDEDTLENWIDEHNYTNEAKLLEAASDISDGIDLIKDGNSLLFVPVPTLVEDLWGITKITNGVLQSVVGFTKFVIWIIEQ